MPYCVPNDIREAVAPDGSLVGTAAELNDEQLARFIQRAQDRVDATTGFSFEDPPNVVVDVTLSLATFYATLAYRKGKSLDQFHPILLMYQDATNMLSQMQQGLIELVSDPVTDTPPKQAGPQIFQPAGTQGIELFPLEESSLTITCDPDSPTGQTIDPALTGWGMY